MPELRRDRRPTSRVEAKRMSFLSLFSSRCTSLCIGDELLDKQTRKQEAAEKAEARKAKKNQKAEWEAQKQRHKQENKGQVSLQIPLMCFDANIQPDPNKSDGCNRKMPTLKDTAVSF